MRTASHLECYFLQITGESVCVEQTWHHHRGSGWVLQSRRPLVDFSLNWIQADSGMLSMSRHLDPVKYTYFLTDSECEGSPFAQTCLNLYAYEWKYVPSTEGMGLFWRSLSEFTSESSCGFIPTFHIPADSDFDLDLLVWLQYFGVPRSRVLRETGELRSWVSLDESTLRKDA